MELKWASKAGSLFFRIALAQFAMLALAGSSCAWATRTAETGSAAALGTTRAASVARKALRNYARLPLSFEPNVGNSNPEVKFLSRGQGYSLFLTANRAVLQLPTRTKTSASPAFRAVSLELLGANPQPQVVASDRLPGVSNYLLGSNPAQWHTGVPHFARVHYRGIYPGVDLVYYGRQQQLEYDFVVAPGADPSRIRLQLLGAQALRLDADGNLIIHLPGGAIHLRRPDVYQQVGKTRRSVAARYILESGNRVAFALAHYDPRRALVIDPRLAYFSYLGGTLNESSPSIAVDSAFNAYLAGTTTSTDFPTLSPYQSSLKGASNIFVTKFNSAGTALVFSTYLGGTGTDTAAGIAVDKGFNVYVAGTTSSANFPITSGSAYQASPKSANNHVFVTELKSSGSGLAYSTYLSGTNADSASGVAVGPLANTVFVTGTTQSTDFANVTRPANLTGSSEFFVAELNTGKQGAASRVYTTYVGGSTPLSSPAVTNGGGIAVDAGGNAYITGGTNYTDMPVVNAHQASMKGTENAFVAKLNPNGTLPALFLTYLGGTGTDIGTSIAADSAGNAYVTGSTTSTTFPVMTATGGTLYQGVNGTGATDAFATKIAAAGTTLIWSTYIGGSGDDSGLGIAVDANQNTFVTGSTTSANLNTVKPTQNANGGGSDAFVAEFDVSGTAQFVSYLGGTGADRGTGIALDVDGNPYVAGDTTSAGLATAGAYQGAVKGGTDAFVAHFAGVSTLAMTAAGAPDPVGVGNAVGFTFTITNQGPDIATAVVFTDTLPGNGTYQSVTPSQGTCSAPAGSTLACSLGQLAVNASATVIVHIAPLTAGPLSDTGTLSSASTTGSTTVGASVNVNDFTVAVSPTNASTPAGQAATYTVTVGPLPQGAGFPNGINLRCSGGVPTAAMCAFSTNPVTPNSTPVTSSLTISTTALPPGTTASLFQHDLPRMYAVILPLGGIAFLGFSGDGRRRRVAGILMLLVVLGLTMLQPACGSSSSKPTVPPFTPAGTYNITLSAISGTGTGQATHTTKLTLVVK